MANIQTMLVMAGMVLLALISLRFNTAVLQTSSAEIESKVALTAFSLADDFIEEIKVKAFDEATLKFPTAAPSNLTPAGSLGLETFEPLSEADDIDDYNNITRIVDAPHAEAYSVRCTVQYVDGNNPDNVSTVQTFYKRVNITVTSPFLKNQIDLSFIFTLK